MLISQMLRPEDRLRFTTPHYALAPIAGLQITAGAVSIGDQMLVRCNRAEWESVEREYIFKSWHREYYSANPVFLYRPFDEPPDPEVAPAIFEELERDAARVVSALRLYKTGRLLEPVYTVRFLRLGATVARAAGPYRTEYLAMPVDGLTWRLEPDEEPDVGQLYGNLKLMEGLEGTEGLLAVVDQFNLSHTPVVQPYFSVHVLLTALEMLFDGVSASVAVETTRYERALHILRWFQGVELDPAFEQFYRDEAHALRNAIHHNGVLDPRIDLAEVRFRLQISVMLGIRLLMRLHRPEVAASITDMQRAYGWQRLRPKDLFNGCLDRLARGDPEPLSAAMRFTG